MSAISFWISIWDCYKLDIYVKMSSLRVRFIKTLYGKGIQDEERVKLSCSLLEEENAVVQSEI